MWFWESNWDVVDWSFGDAVELHGKDSWKFLGIEGHGFWGHVVQCHGLRFKECHAKHYFSIDKTCHWNDRITLALKKTYCNNTDAYYINMRVILLLHLFNISPTKTLDFNDIAYEGLDKRTKGMIQKAALSFTCSHVSKSTRLPRVRLELTTFRLWDWRAA